MTTEQSIENNNWSLLKKINDFDIEFNFFYENDTIVGKAKHLTKDDFLLTNRGFHWINEFPMNR